jgi:hypothetical protein
MNHSIVRFPRPIAIHAAILGTLLTFVPMGGLAQARPDPGALIAAQRKAMIRFTSMDGVWRGPAWIILPSGEKITFTQTERVGPFLDGSIKVMEGRGYGPDGKTTFNAFGILSYNSTQQTYTLHSYAEGYVGDFVFRPSVNGYSWDIPAGPMTIHYTAQIEDGAWHEVGDRLSPGKEPVRFFEMDAKRVGNTDWPVGGAIQPK